MPKFVSTRARLLGTNTLLIACVGLLSTSTKAAPSVAPNATRLVVTTPSDTVNPNDGKLSLREAMTQANAAEDGGLITFNFGASGNIKSQTIQINELLPQITGRVVISNTRTAPLIINGQTKRKKEFSSGVFYVDASGSLTLNTIQIEKGQNLFGSGGAILNQGQVSVNGCTFLKCGSLLGGAIYNGLGAVLSATNTTFSGNYAIGKGAVVEPKSKSVKAQQLPPTGQDVQNSGQVSFTNCTLKSNGSRDAAIVNELGSLSLWNTILSNESGTIYPTIINSNGATVTSLGHNLATDNGGGFLTASGDQTNTDPKLGELSLAKGDLVSTFSLKSGSPARDGGDSAVFYAPYNLRQDARGQNRFQGSAVDIGAVEVANSAPSGSFASRTNGKVGTPVRITTSWRDADGAADILSAQAYFAQNAMKTGPALRIEQRGESDRIFLVSDGPSGNASVDITEAALAGTASSQWFSNLKAQISRQSDGVLSVEWTFTPLEPLIGQRKAFLSTVDRSGAGGIGPGAPFGALNITKAGGGKSGKNEVGESSVNSA